MKEESDQMKVAIRVRDFRLSFRKGEKVREKRVYGRLFRPEWATCTHDRRLGISRRDTSKEPEQALGSGETEN